MPTSDLRSIYVDLLREQAFGCRHPSPTHLDRLEAVIQDHEAGEEYVRTLLDLMSEERFASPTMMDRVAGLIEALERSGNRAG